MTDEEKRAWIRLIVAVVAYGAYLIIILGRAGGGPLTQTPYAATLLWSVGAAIVAAIVAEIPFGARSKAGRAKDVRDREIAWRGDYIGQSFVVIGAVSGMLMALAGWDRFWIANVIYLCFVLSAVLGNIAKIGLYHGSFPQW
jgi:hypothetical protein